MKITIVTVTYNCSRILEKTIKSVISQTYKEIEYIIVDGGSTDGTIEIIKKYDSKIAKWISEPDKGIYDAMNKGIDMATGEWINFMNAGDMFYSNITLSNIFNKDYSGFDFIYGDRIYVNKDGQKYEKPLLFFETTKYCPTKGCCHQSTFVKKNIAIKYKFSLEYKFSGDYEMMYRIYKSNGRFLYRPIVVALYDVTDSLSAKNRFLGRKEDAQLLGLKKNCKYYIYFSLLWLKTMFVNLINK